MILVGMWAAAAAARLFLWLGRDDSAELRPARPAPGTPVRVRVTDEEDRAPAETRAEQPVAEMPEGPPLMSRGDRRHTGRTGFRGPTSAAVAWRFDTEARVTAQPVATRDGRIYVGSHDGTFFALNDSGGEQWRRDLGGPIYSTPAIDERGNVYVGSDARVFTSFSRNGDARWRIQTDGDADTGVVISDAGIIHFGAGSELWAVQSDGTVDWRFQAQGKIFSTPAVDDDGTVYVGSQDDHLYAIASDGREST